MSSRVKNYDAQWLKDSLGTMLCMRRFEEKAGQMYGLKKIGGFCHLYSGQEAVAAGSIRALDLKKDYVLTSYRDHAHAIACGIDPKNIMAELYGKITGVSRGKGGSMHMFDIEKGMYGGNGIVGAQIPLATGTAFAQAYWYKLGKVKERGVSLCYFGDGAVNQGAFHESLNLASIWNLPVIYLVENNRFGMGTAVTRVSAVEDFEIKAPGYNMEGKNLNGMDFLDMYEGIKELVAESRKNGKAYLVDVKTYRYKGHSMSDPAKYRTKEELDHFKNLDPIITLKGELLEAKLITEDEFKAMDDAIKKEVAEAIDFADKSPEPPMHTMYEDIYAD